MTGPVLIAGAGPTGLTAAVELARLGIPVRIIDRKPQPVTTSRALAVHARTLEIMEPRGLAETMVQLGNPAHATLLFEDGKQVASINFSHLPSRYPYILMLSQAETERLMRERLAGLGVTVERPVELIAIAQRRGVPGDGSDSVTAVLRHQDGRLEELQSPCLIATEGAHSDVRHTLGMSFEGSAMHLSFQLADVYVDGPLANDSLSMFLSEQGFLGAFPFGAGHFRLIASEPRNWGPAPVADPTLEESQALFNTYTGISGRLHDMVWSSRFHINTRMLKTLRSGSVFFGGDSAHVHSPAGGQGMNTGIQDMVNLCWKLAWVLQGKAAPKLLDTYDGDRLPVIREVLRTTEGMTGAVGSSRVGQFLIKHALPLVLGLGAVERKGTLQLSQLAFDYRHSSLSASAGQGGSIHAGDRVPELQVVVVAKEDSGAQRLASLISPSLLTLLIANPQRTRTGTLDDVKRELQPWSSILKVEEVTPAAEDKEQSELFEQVFGKPPGMFVARPDSYFGFASDASSLAPLKAWLLDWFPV